LNMDNRSGVWAQGRGGEGKGRLHRGGGGSEEWSVAGWINVAGQVGARGSEGKGIPVQAST